MSHSTLRLMPPAMREAYLAELGRAYAGARVGMVYVKAREDADDAAEVAVNSIIGMEELIALSVDVQDGPNDDLAVHYDLTFRPEGTTRSVVGRVAAAEPSDGSIVICVKEGADYARVYGAPVAVVQGDNVMALLEWRDEKWWAKEMRANG